MAILHSGIATFLGAPHVAPTAQSLREAGADVAILGLPYDSTTITRPGAAHGPRGIRDASSHFGFAGGYQIDYDVTITDHLTLVDCGDVNGVAGRAQETVDRTEQVIDEIYQADCMPILVGGDHMTTIPATRSLSKTMQGSMGFVLFDTHLDTAPDVDGEVNSHCSPVHRVLDLPNVSGENVVIIGAHGAANPLYEKEVADTHGVTVYTVRDIDRMGIDAVAEEAIRIASAGTEGVYCSVDIDVLDGAFAWGTCGPEIGGMTGRELVRGIELVMQGPVRAMDCVEVAPYMDGSGNTSRVGARIVVDMLAAHACKLRDGTLR